ncbi:transketolase family protein [Candidatus Similichlamydia laticola]|uniref:transketolase n=1 Tax=Candidatus Similichlamydia laticola TaxID=2170265 RepID=A0A369KEM1_9BACT|nr:transketolase [Candidatus Similichlamydia laticola]RDB31347.1 Transketolase [Candidatus Similichlamydia laticola]
MSFHAQSGVLSASTLSDLARIATTIRCLSADIVEKAGSGHPGLPMGCAEIGAYLFGLFLRFNPEDPHWEGRDRFILSAGHGSAWLYSCLHLSGFDLSIDSLKEFRQLHSITPGHPERGITPGVESTTGPLGQGIAHAVGQALGLQVFYESTQNGSPSLPKVIALCGDGCLMEGVSYEAASFAGHLGLNNLILVFDSNGVCLDGFTKDCWTDDVALRFESCGWKVFQIDGHSFEELHQVFSSLRKEQSVPTIILARTTIGRGAPSKSGTNRVHGSPLGKEEVTQLKKASHFPPTPFHVPVEVYDFFAIRKKELQSLAGTWTKEFEKWLNANKRSKQLYLSQRSLPRKDIEEAIWGLELDADQAGRSLSQQVVVFLADRLLFLLGGSADLSSSDKTFLEKYGFIGKANFSGRNIKYGVREFAMSAIASGLAQTGHLVPFVGTFLTFSDYMRNGIRLAALMQLQVIFVFTHDSILLGEDGPTHQPIEHVMSLRLIPGLQVIRPGSSEEVKLAWILALRYQGPTAIILPRKKFGCLPVTKADHFDMCRGGYLYLGDKGVPCDCLLLATGTELALACDVAEQLKKNYRKNVRVVSLPCWSVFEQQSEAYRLNLLDRSAQLVVSLEAGISLGWERHTGSQGLHIAVETWGASAPSEVLREHYGFTAEQVTNKILDRLNLH